MQRPREEQGSGEGCLGRQPDTLPPGMWETEGGGRKAAQSEVPGASATARE